MRITLLNEGTYPYTPGGTSVWCDLLIANLPQHEFDLLTITATGRDTPVWPVHPNVKRVRQVALWGQGSIQQRTRKPGLVDGEIVRLFQVLAGGGDQQAFRDIIMNLSSMPLHTFEQAMCSDHVIEAVLATWSPQVPAPVTVTVADALAACNVLQHTMRPLWIPADSTDVNHAVVNGLIMLPALAAKWRSGTPILLSEHGVYLRERYLEPREESASGVVSGIMLSFYRMLATAGYQHADVIAPVTDFNRRWEERVGAVNTPIVTIHNGIDPSGYPQIHSEPGFPTISWIGRIDPIKDLHTLIRAFKLVRESIPAAKLRLFGPVSDGCEAYAESCRKLVRELGLVADVSFDGPVDASPAAFEAGHVVALSSISEGMPYTVVEAMMCGRPTVSTDVGGVSEAVADCGIVVPPRDPDSMALWLVHFLENAEDRHAVGARARERALDLFRLERSIASYDDVYHRVGAIVPESEQSSMRSVG